jgi:hypothetical protein
VQDRRPDGHGAGAQPGQQHLAYFHRPLDLPRQGEHFGQRLIDATPRRDVVRADQGAGPHQRGLGAGQGTHSQITPPGLE